MAGKNLMVWTVNLPEHMMEVCVAFCMLRSFIKQRFAGGTLGSQCNYHGRDKDMA